MSVNWQDIAFSFLGGLGLFLFSIKYMGDGLQQAAGDKLRFYIDKYTSNPFLGVLIGIVMTALIQSSSGVTVIVVGLVSAGLLSLRQAIGIVMGGKHRNNRNFLHDWFQARRLCPSSDFPGGCASLLHKQ